ncbi:RES family NAD+ phosphorylase [Adhaeribacter radiodurans]|uniref:RES family NAD+ phosphorylase n=1 Tax=Adhaeribacter radiodurans TaxID=2745197 RepID=A0A7L7LCN1_9BACT|nr:RES family NAD+ phosphorylase [Adhaeribacter radiodurans]QMU30533.1 RES family NAD+ phosphorylase [Adhaeribacter radiodurans]
MAESRASTLVGDSPVLAYRLVKERFIGTPLSTEGARLYGGRWNPPGTGILYTSASPELALLEQLVHLPTLPYEDLPRLFLITLALPEVSKLLQELPPTWREESGYQANHKLIANWLANPHVLALGVSSAVVKESLNYLLHPKHPDYNRIEIISTSPFNIDPRLWHDRDA